MRHVAYGGESFLTSDEAGEALLALAAAAAMSGIAEVVQVPSVREDGSVESVKLVVGPSSELLMSPAHSALAEPDTTDATAVLRDRAFSLGASSSHAFGAAIASADLDSEDRDSDDLDSAKAG